MYEPGTVLALREPLSTDDKPYPYDRVVVIGTSPVQHATPAGSPWQGVEATGILLQPAGEAFGGNVDKPLGEVTSLYEVEEYPIVDQVAEPLAPKNQDLVRLSPEQLLQQAAKDQDAVRARVRMETLQSNDKSPEQVLREEDQKAKNAQTRARRAKKEPTSTDE